MDFEAGDVGYVQKTLPHYIDNTGDNDLRFIEVFRSSRFDDLSLSEWLSHTPPELVMAHFNIDQGTYCDIPTEKSVILPREAQVRTNSSIHRNIEGKRLTNPASVLD